MSVHPLQAFYARAEARAILFGAGEYPDADAAIMPLLNDAWHGGLVDKFGIDVLMEIVEAAFAPFWEIQ